MRKHRRDPMAISPLDLQTLFTQMDKVGKQEMAQRDGAAVLQSVQNIRHQQQTDVRLRSVNETQDTGDGTEGIKDKNGGRQGHGEHKNQAAEDTEEHTEEGSGFFRDPDLGRNIDVSL